MGKPSRLVDHLVGCGTIATVGLCKNAGKTTVLNYLVDYYRAALTVGITSIGYDGEEKDAITLLPKPRIRVYPGMLVATTSQCLAQTAIAYRLLLETGISTNLGPVCIVKVLSAGQVEVSGPAIASQMQSVSAEMRALGADLVIVDGAAGRLSFAAHTDGAILSVGAAMSRELGQVVKQAKHLIELLTLPVGPPTVESCPEREVFHQQLIAGVPHFVFRGAMADRDLVEIKQRASEQPPVAVVNDAASIFISPRAYAKFKQQGGAIVVRRQINLLAVTVNPMSPYGPWFDETLFLAAMAAVSQLPVFNIMQEKVKSDDE